MEHSAKSQLQSAVARLNALVAPVTKYTHGPKVWLPVPGDTQAQLKSEIINKALAVLAVGEAALLGDSPTSLPSFGVSEWDAIERGLSSDPEEHSYAELASASESILSILSQATS